jgi:uncharacterized membrane protein affecting hemolysin expression
MAPCAAQATSSITEQRRLEVTVTLLIVLALLIALDLGAWWWSRDSRDGRDWRS